MSILASVAQAAALRPHEHLVVRVGPERFALPLAEVAEAIDAPAVRTVAGTDAACLGYVPWRGRQLAVRCAAAAFGQAAARPCAAAIVLVGADHAVAVDEVLDVVALPPEHVRPLRGLNDPLGAVAGVAADARGLVAVLHAAAVRSASGGEIGTPMAGAAA